jgi:hypothetical protein
MISRRWLIAIVTVIVVATIAVAVGMVMNAGSNGLHNYLGNKYGPSSSYCKNWPKYQQKPANCN